MFATQKNTTEKHKVNPRPLFVRVVKTKSEINMKWLTIEDIKKQLRIDYSYEDDVLDLYGSSAEDTVLNYINRSYQELLETYGEVPAPIRQATLMLVDNSYQHRTPDAITQLHDTRAFDTLVASYIRHAYGAEVIPQNVFIVGSQLKILIDAELPDNLTLQDVDFTVVVYNNNAKDLKETYRKADCILTTDGDYAVLVESENLGVGTYLCRLTVNIPDTDYPTGYRKEVVKINPHITVKG